MINNFVIGKVVGTGSTLLLLARNKEQLEVKMERASPTCRSSSIVCQETKAMAREVRPGLAVEVISLYFIIWILSSV